MPENLLINQRFRLNKRQHVLTDLQTGIDTRLELRHIQVLLMLTERPGQVVDRKELITTVWNDYGGADEALNQAVSFLRKALADADKRLIRTIPKQGYMLEGEVTESAPPAPLQPSSKTSKWVIRVIMVITALYIVMILLTKFMGQQEVKTPAEPEGAVPDTSYAQKEREAAQRPPQK